MTETEISGSERTCVNAIQRKMKAEMALTSGSEAVILPFSTFSLETGITSEPLGPDLVHMLHADVVHFAAAVRAVAELLHLQHVILQRNN